MAEQTGWAQTKAIWANANNRLIYKLLGWSALVLIGLLIGRAFYAAAPDDGGHAWDYGINVFTSVISTLFTVTVIEIFNRKRAEDELKRQLVDDSASTSNAIAKNAVHQLRRKGWLVGEAGMLTRANLGEANLEGANLDDARLDGANLRYAYLVRTRLIHAHLPGADLMGAHLHGAKLASANLKAATLTVADLRDALLDGANLQGAGLNGAHLGGAKLWLTDLQGANLHEAILEGAKLQNARFSETTVLPDKSHWTAQTDMRRFTDRKHPNFWEAPSFAGD